MKSQLHKTKGMKWSDLDTPAKAFIVLLAIEEIAEKLIVWHHIYHRPASKTRGPKWMWVLLSFINGIGPLSYAMFGRKK